jgi:hypothetical protein
MSRFTIIKRVLATVFASTTVLPSIGQGVSNGSLGYRIAIPQQATYSITIDGVTGSGNTAFRQRNTTYATQRKFRLSGKLVVVPAQDSTGVNGINARDIGIFCGNPIAGQAGAIWFASNTRVFALVGLGNNVQRNANLNAARVSIKENSGVLNAFVAARNISMSSQLNFFNTTSGITAVPYQITNGRLALRFSEGGDRVSGEMRFIGTGYVGPENSAITASISGVQR